jgi:hypothetical protein
VQIILFRAQKWIFFHQIYTHLWPCREFGKRDNEGPENEMTSRLHLKSSSGWLPIGVYRILNAYFRAFISKFLTRKLNTS